MKKSVYLGIIALATMSLASCSIDDTIMSVPDAEAIEFGTYLGRGVTTRGQVFDDADMKATNAGFGVFAFYTGQETWGGTDNAGATATPNFMYNQNVTWDGSAWAYTPKKYWPTTQGDKITFFAYAPMAATTNGLVGLTANNTGGTPVVTYTIAPDRLEDMADFVADAVIDQQRTTGTASSDVATNVDDETQPVSFGLNHELTRVNIKAKLSTDAYDDATDGANRTKVNITDIKFYGTGFATTGEYKFAQTNDSRGNWTYTGVGDAAVSIFDDADAEFIDKAKDEDLGATGVGYETVGVAVPTTAEVAVFTANEYLFLIPPTEGGVTTTGSTPKNVTMLVEYDIVTADASLADKHSVTSATKVIPLPAGVLAQGVAYNFVLTFGLNEVTLSADVAEWNDPETDNPHNVDWPKGDA